MSKRDREKLIEATMVATFTFQDILDTMFGLSAREPARTGPYTEKSYLSIPVPDEFIANDFKRIDCILYPSEKSMIPISSGTELKLTEALIAEGSRDRAGVIFEIQQELSEIPSLWYELIVDGVCHRRQMFQPSRLGHVHIGGSQHFSDPYESYEEHTSSSLSPSSSSLSLSLESSASTPRQSFHSTNAIVYPDNSQGVDNRRNVPGNLSVQLHESALSMDSDFELIERSILGRESTASPWSPTAAQMVVWRRSSEVELAEQSAEETAPSDDGRGAAANAAPNNDSPRPAPNLNPARDTNSRGRSESITLDLTDVLKVHDQLQRKGRGKKCSVM